MNYSKDQIYALSMLREFVSQNEYRVFVLCGPAGSGKSSVLSTIIDESDKKYILCASTGRAANILAYKTRTEAGTVHSRFFTVKIQKGLPSFTSKESMEDAIYIIDEASMLQNERDGSIMSSRSLIGEIIYRINSLPNSKVIFVGDSFQLEPVGEKKSTALNLEDLSKIYQVKVMSADLDVVHRQGGNSGILKLATAIRTQDKDWKKERFDDSHDVIIVRRKELMKTLSREVEEQTFARVKYIAVRNKTINEMNYRIRSDIQGWGSELRAGDRLLVVHNNTFFTGKKNMIANGEDCRVIDLIGNVEAVGGSTYNDKVYEPFIFQDATVEIKSLNGDLDNKRVKLLLNPIFSSSSSINKFEEKRFYYYFQKLDPKGYRNNPYYRALRVKYGYAMTGHKAQGGEWDTVFVDVGDWKNSRFGNRWLYTAVTRPKQKLYLVTDDE